MVKRHTDAHIGGASTLCLGAIIAVRIVTGGTGKCREFHADVGIAAHQVALVTGGATVEIATTGVAYVCRAAMA